MRKLEKALFLDPEVIQKDTLFVHDTLFIKSSTHDTLTRVIYHDSTIVINNDRLRVEYFFDTITQNIYIEGECKPDTVTIEKKVIMKTPNRSILDNVKTFPFWVWVVLVSCLMVVLSFFRGKKRG